MEEKEYTPETMGILIQSLTEGIQNLGKPCSKTDIQPQDIEKISQLSLPEKKAWMRLFNKWEDNSIRKAKWVLSLQKALLWGQIKTIRGIYSKRTVTSMAFGIGAVVLALILLVISTAHFIPSGYKFKLFDLTISKGEKDTPTQRTIQKTPGAIMEEIPQEEVFLESGVSEISATAKPPIPLKTSPEKKTVGEQEKKDEGLKEKIIKQYIPRYQRVKVKNENTEIVLSVIALLEQIAWLIFVYFLARLIVYALVLRKHGKNIKLKILGKEVDISDNSATTSNPESKPLSPEEVKKMRGIINDLA